MKPDEVKKIQPGLYRIKWLDGSEMSLAAVGVDFKGRRWIAPTNWDCNVPCFDWGNVAQLESISIKPKYRAITFPEKETLSPFPEDAKEGEFKGIVSFRPTIDGMIALGTMVDNFSDVHETVRKRLKRLYPGLPFTQKQLDIMAKETDDLSS